MRRKSLALVAAAFAATALSLSACGGGSTPAASSSGGSSAASGAAGVTLKNPGKLTVCSDIPYKPFEYEEGGKYVGFDMDIAAEIAKKAGAELNVVKAGFDSIQSGLFKSQCDIAVSGISITEKRKGNMDFSTPYLDDDLVLVAKKGSGITNLDSAKGKKVSVQGSTTGSDYAKEKGIEATAFETGELQVQSLIAGTTDASLGNQSILRYGIKGKDDLEVVEEIKTGEQLGVAVKKGDTAMLTLVNDTIKAMESDGKMDEIKKKWFGDA